jgi:hypothetical protein
MGPNRFRLPFADVPVGRGLRYLASDKVFDLYLVRLEKEMPMRITAHEPAIAVIKASDMMAGVR